MTNPMIVEIKRLAPEKTGDVPLPKSMSEDAAGMDIFAAVEKELTILPGQTVAVPTGFAIAVPRGYEAQVRPRSGLAMKHSLIVPNSPGTIDSDYRGEVRVLLSNLGANPFAIRRGDRIAQMVVCPVMRIEWKETAELSDTERGAGGFGHTGV